jgi:uncharacterized protein YndB with AHSA1/START domain
MAGTTIEVERRLAAPPEMVFDAWLDPEGVGQWLFATPGGMMEAVEIDPRVGGGFTIAERRGEELARHFGEYIELERPCRLVFDFWTSVGAERTRVTVEIPPDGDGARIRLTHNGVRADYRERTMQGWTMILGGMTRHLEH